MSHNHNINKHVRLALNLFVPLTIPEVMLTNNPTEILLGIIGGVTPTPPSVSWLISPRDSYKALQSSNIFKPLVGSLYVGGYFAGRVRLYLGPSNLAPAGQTAPTSLFAVSLGAPFPLAAGINVFIADSVDACCREDNKNPCIFFDFLELAVPTGSPTISAAILAQPCQGFFTSAFQPCHGLTTPVLQPFTPDLLFTDADVKFLSVPTKCSPGVCDSRGRYNGNGMCVPKPLVFNVYSPSVLALTVSVGGLITQTVGTIANLNSSNFLGKVNLQAAQPTTPGGRVTLTATSASDEPVLIPPGSMFVSEGCCCDGDIQIIQFPSASTGPIPPPLN